MRSVLGRRATLVTMFKKHPRRRGSPAEGVSHTPKSSPTPGILATSPNTGIDHGDDVVSEISSHRIDGFLANRAASVVVDAPKEVQEKHLLELRALRNTLGKN